MLGYLDRIRSERPRSSTISTSRRLLYLDSLVGRLPVWFSIRLGQTRTARQVRSTVSAMALQRLDGGVCGLLLPLSDLPICRGPQSDCVGLEWHGSDQGMFLFALWVELLLMHPVPPVFPISYGVEQIHPRRSNKPGGRHADPIWLLLASA